MKILYIRRKRQTDLKVECAWCGAPLGTKDGKGTTGVSHGICRKCADKEWAKLGGRPPARWNIIGRILYRRRQNRRRLERLEREHELLEEADKKANEQAAAEELLATNPALHLQIILRGKPGVHYIDAADLVALEKWAAGQPEFNIRWN
jgi:hypothetical protein